MILTFASSKGGVGKSTTCAAIAAALARTAPVLLLDLDQNRTLHRWSRKAPLKNLTVEAVEPDAFGAIFRAADASGTYAHICIDLPGSREVTLFKALARSDLVIIPAQASEPDLREALVVAGDVRDVSETTARPIPYRVLLTKLYPLRTRVTDFIVSELLRLQLPVFETALIERAAYREMFLTGAPPDPAGASRAAALEIQALLDEITALVAPKGKTRRA